MKIWQFGFRMIGESGASDTPNFLSSSWFAILSGSIGQSGIPTVGLPWLERETSELRSLSSVVFLNQRVRVNALELGSRSCYLKSESLDSA